MNILLDTHILIWALNDDPRLSAKARTLILDEDHTIYCSVVSLWEVAVKHAIHPENVEFTGAQLGAFCREAGYLLIEMKDKHVYALETLNRKEDAPPHHAPFDRMLIAQAKAEKMSLLTHDTQLSFYGEKCVVLV